MDHSTALDYPMGAITDKGLERMGIRFTLRVEPRRPHKSGGADYGARTRSRKMGVRV